MKVYILYILLLYIIAKDNINYNFYFPYKLNNNISIIYLQIFVLNPKVI